jgi:hypothetical protein
MDRKKTIGAWLTWGIAGCGLLFARTAYGQSTGVLTGAVLDASTRQPVADVAVTATSAALQGEQTVVTDGAGSYRIPQLPPGNYTVRLEKEAYKPYASGGITLRVNSTIRVNVELLPSALKEEIVVVGKAPTVDVGSTTTGVTVDAAVVNRLALNPPGTRNGALRSFDSLALLAPGTHADGLGVSFNGTSSSQNRFQIDGLSVNNSGNALNDSPLSMEFIKEVNIATGGYMPEFGRATGGIYDVLTKSGSNELHGSVFFSVTPGGLEGARTPVRVQGTTVTLDTKLSALRDFGFEVGGPILKDKLWFYGGLNLAFQDNATTRRINRLRYEKSPDGSLKLDESGNPIRSKDEFGFQLADPIPGTEKVYYASKRTYQYIGKLTWLLNPNHNLTLLLHGSPARSGGDGKLSLRPDNGSTFFGGPEIGPGQFSGIARIETSDIHSASLKLASAFMEKRLLLDVMLGVHHAEFDIRPADGSPVGGSEGVAGVPGVFWTRSSPGYHSIADFEALPAGSGCDPAGTKAAIYCPVTSYRTGGPGHTEEITQNRYQAKATGTYLLSALGHHVIKAGMDLEVTTHHEAEANTGGIWYYEDYGGESFLAFHYGNLVSPNDIFVPATRQFETGSTLIGGFVQDSWSVLDRVTLNAGVRYDAQLISTSESTGMTLPSQWSPRVGAIYDFTRDGRSKVFASFARYYENVTLDIAKGFVSVPLNVSSVSAAACDPRDPANKAACDAPESRQNLGPPFAPNRKWYALGGYRAPVDPDLEAASTDEISVGGEYEIFPQARAGVTYTHRYLNNVIDSMSRDEGTTAFIGNPGYGPTRDFPKAKRDYDAGTLYFQKAFSSEWLAMASYTVSSLRGNYSGGGDFFVISLLPNRDGPLPGDRTHSLKVFGAKEIALPGSLVLNVGASYQAASGTPLNVLGTHPILGEGGVYILPRGSGGRLPWTHTIDSNLNLGYRISKDSELTVSLSVFNLFNFQGVTAQDELFTYASVRPIIGGTLADLPKEDSDACADAEACPSKLVDFSGGTPFNPKGRNPNYGSPTSYQTPRQVRFGAKVTF